MQLPNWQLAAGGQVTCEEKIKLLNENFIEAQQVCKDMYEDAVLMGCDEVQVKQALEDIVGNISKN